MSQTVSLKCMCMPLVQLPPLLKPADLAEETFPLYPRKQRQSNKWWPWVIRQVRRQPVQRHLLYTT